MRFARLSFPWGIFTRVEHEAGLRRREHVPSAQPNYRLDIRRRPFLHRLFPLALMPRTHSTASLSSNFQLIIDNALTAYEKRTKQDLLAHPLAAQFQTCDSPAAILSVLQQQAQGLNQSGSSDDRWTKWLDPTINVLFTFSATVGAGAGLVSVHPPI